MWTQVAGWLSTLGRETFLPTNHGNAVYSENLSLAIHGSLTMSANEIVVLSETVFLFLTPDIALRQDYGGEDTEDFIMCSLVLEPQRGFTYSRYIFIESLEACVC